MVALEQKTFSFEHMYCMPNQPHTVAPSSVALHLLCIDWRSGMSLGTYLHCLRQKGDQEGSRREGIGQKFDLMHFTKKI